MCVFCDIIDGKIPSKKHFENNDFIVIDDISHKAKKHYLLIPKKHYVGLFDQSEDDAIKLAKMLRFLPSLQSELGLEDGYRLIINQGGNAGQSVMHLHIHILGGEILPIAP